MNSRARSPSDDGPSGSKRPKLGTTAATLGPQANDITDIAAEMPYSVSQFSQDPTAHQLVTGEPSTFSPVSRPLAVTVEAHSNPANRGVYRIIIIYHIPI